MFKSAALCLAFSFGVFAQTACDETQLAGLGNETVLNTCIASVVAVLPDASGNFTVAQIQQICATESCSTLADGLAAANANVPNCTIPIPELNVTDINLSEVVTGYTLLCAGAGDSSEGGTGTGGASDSGSGSGSGNAQTLFTHESRTLISFLMLLLLSVAAL